MSRGGPAPSASPGSAPRRSVCIALGLLPALLAQDAYARKRLPRVGMLMLAASRGDGPGPALLEGLRKLGYVDAQSMHFEYRTALGERERLPALARELAVLPVDVVVTGAAFLAKTMQQATRDIPIVVVLNDEDPVAAGLAASLSRPGGNVTGIYTQPSELAAKRLELLKEALPRTSRVAVLWETLSEPQMRGLLARGASGLDLLPIELRQPYDLKEAFQAAKRQRADAVLLLFSPTLFSHRARLAELALELGLPLVANDVLHVVAGGLMSYGSTVEDTFGRAAYFVDRILKGARPADLPIEQATSFKLVINLRTARALKIDLPEAVLMRADELVR